MYSRAFRFLPDSLLRNKLASDDACDEPETGYTEQIWTKVRRSTIDNHIIKDFDQGHL